MKRFLGTLSLFCLTVSSAFASTGVVDVNVDQRGRGSVARISFGGEAAEQLYYMIGAPEAMMPEIPNDGNKMIFQKTGRDLVCYKMVKQSFKMDFGFGHGPMPVPMPMPPGGPGRPYPPVFPRPDDNRGEDRLAYSCETRMNQQGEVELDGWNRR